MECKAIEREESARCNGPGEVITESLLIILEGNLTTTLIGDSVDTEVVLTVVVVIVVVVVVVRTK